MKKEKSYWFVCNESNKILKIYVNKQCAENFINKFDQALTLHGIPCNSKSFKLVDNLMINDIFPEKEIWHQKF